jgi:hypothetical protein
MSNVGLDFDWEKLETKKVLFKNIDLIMPVKINGKEYTEIHIGGNSYIAKEHYIDILNFLLKEK